MLLANGQEGFTLHAELNWHVLVVTLALSLLCGVLFGLAPALQSTRPALMPMLRDRSVSEPRGRVRDRVPRLNLTQALVVAQIAISLLLLVAAGLFVRTLSNLQSISLGFNRDRVLLFQLNAPQAGYPESRVAAFYADLRRRFGEVPGVPRRDAVARLAHQGRPLAPGHGRRRADARHADPVYGASLLHHHADSDVAGAGDRRRRSPGNAARRVVSELFARANFGDANPVGRHIEVRGGMRSARPSFSKSSGSPQTCRYGGLKREIPPVVYVPYAQLPSPQLQEMTYALRTDGDPLRYVSAVRQIVHQADDRVPRHEYQDPGCGYRPDHQPGDRVRQAVHRVCDPRAGDRLRRPVRHDGVCGGAPYERDRTADGPGSRTRRRHLDGTARGLRAGGDRAGDRRADRPRGVAIDESFLFEIKPGDPRALALAMAILLSAAVAAGYGPARRASRVDPMIALRHE